MFNYSCAFFHYDCAFKAFYLDMLSTDSSRVFYFQIFYHRNREMMSFTLDSFRGSFRLISRTTSVFSKGVNTTISTGRLYYSYIIPPITSMNSLIKSKARNTYSRKPYQVIRSQSSLKDLQTTSVSPQNTPMCMYTVATLYRN